MSINTNTASIPKAPTINFAHETNVAFSADEYIKLEKTQNGYRFSTTSDKDKSTDLCTVSKIFKDCTPSNANISDVETIKSCYERISAKCKDHNRRYHEAWITRLVFNILCVGLPYLLSKTKLHCKCLDYFRTYEENFVCDIKGIKRPITIRDIPDDTLAITVQYLSNSKDFINLGKALQTPKNKVWTTIKDNIIKLEFIDLQSSSPTVLESSTLAYKILSQCPKVEYLKIPIDYNFKFVINHGMLDKSAGINKDQLAILINYPIKFKELLVTVNAVEYKPLFFSEDLQKGIEGIENMLRSYKKYPEILIFCTIERKKIVLKRINFDKSDHISDVLTHYAINSNIDHLLDNKELSLDDLKDRQDIRYQYIGHGVQYNFNKQDNCTITYKKKSE